MAKWPIYIPFCLDNYHRCRPKDPDRQQCNNLLDIYKKTAGAAQKVCERGANFEFKSSKMAGNASNNAYKVMFLINKNQQKKNFITSLKNVNKWHFIILFYIF